MVQGEALVDGRPAWRWHFLDGPSSLYIYSDKSLDSKSSTGGVVHISGASLWLPLSSLGCRGILHVGWGGIPDHDHGVEGHCSVPGKLGSDVLWKGP